jgi:hypothetical protein
MSDDNLDNLFKKGLSERSVAFNMDSWRKMEQMLPAETKPAGFRFGLVASLIGGVMILMSGFLIWSTSKSETSQIAERVTTELGLEAVSGSSNSAKNEIGTVDLVNPTKEKRLKSSSEFSEMENASDMESVLNSERARSTATKNITELKNKETVQNPSVKANSNSNKTKNSFFAKNEGFKILSLDAEQMEVSAMSKSETESLSMVSLDEGQIFSIQEDQYNTLFAEVGDSKLPKLKKNEFGFLAGVTITNDLVNSPQNGFSGCEVLGLTYQRYFNGGFSVMANLLYAPRNEVNAVKHFDKKVYGFGSVTEQTMVESQRLVYLELPLMINYNLGNHNFMAGSSLSYLMTGLHKVSTEYVTQTETTVDDSMQWGHTDGFNKLDFALVAGYEYSIKPKLNLGVRLNYGLMDVTRNEYFGSDSFDNNVQFRVYLKYAPFQF